MYHCFLQEHNTMTWTGLEPGPSDPESSKLTINETLLFSSQHQSLSKNLLSN